MSHYHELSLTAQTAYAELFDAATAQELQRSVASLNGSFARKVVKGRIYHYFQYRDLDGSVRQLYVGPDSERVRHVIGESGTAAPRTALIPLARSALALGCAPILPRHYRIIRRLCEYGFFHAGGVLIGTHAFLCFGNMLGVDWSEETRTQDVDLAHAGKNITVALPATVTVNVHKALESLEMGFLPITSFDGKPGATYLNPNQPDLRIDFVTTRHRGGDEPFVPPNMNVAFQPLPFMDFLLEDVTQSALISSAGAVVVNTPTPSRYAVHKLLVCGERNVAQKTKALKDVRQSAALIAWSLDHDPAALSQAWSELLARGKGWRTRAQNGLRALAKFDSALCAPLEQALR